MGKKKWQTHLVGCPIKPLLGWHAPTQKEREHMKKEVKKHDREGEKKDG